MKKKTTMRTKRISPVKRAKRESVTAPKGVKTPYAWSNHDDLIWQKDRFIDLIARFQADERQKMTGALEYARAKHEHQSRIGGAPYIVHPIRIANILLDEWRTDDADMIVAGLLHDIVEDTSTTVKELKQMFGNEVGSLVDGMTMWKGSETHEIYLRRVARGPEKLRLIKCADAVDNLRSWPASTAEADEKFPRWWKQAHDHVLPMAEGVNKKAAKIIRLMLNDPWYRKQAHVS